MKKIKNKNAWILLLLMLSGLVLGGFLATLTQNLPIFHWLSYGETFGLQSPIVLSLGIIIITFGLSIKITIGSIIGLVVAAVVYHYFI